MGCVSNIFLLFRGLAATLACKYNKKQSAKACASSWSETWKFLYFQRLGKLGCGRKKTKRIKKTCFRCVGCVVMKGFWLKDVRCCCTYVFFFGFWQFDPCYLSDGRSGFLALRCLEDGRFWHCQSLVLYLSLCWPLRIGCFWFRHLFFATIFSENSEQWSWWLVVFFKCGVQSCSVILSL